MPRRTLRSKRNLTPSVRLQDYDLGSVNIDPFKSNKKTKHQQPLEAQETKKDALGAKKRKQAPAVCFSKSSLESVRPDKKSQSQQLLDSVLAEKGMAPVGIRSTNRSKKPRTNTPLSTPRPPNPGEWEGRSLGDTVFYDPADTAQMNALWRDSSIIMLGNAEERAKWPVLVYKSNAAYGFGLVAKRCIKKDEVIVPYLGVKTKVTDDDELPERQSAYAFQFDKDTCLFAHKYASVAAFANYSFSIPNLYCVKEKDSLVYKAAFDIPAGSALLIDYGIYYKFKNPTLYLCPYQNGKTPTENLEHYKEFYDTQPIELNNDLKTLFKTNATHCIAPKIYKFPNLLNAPDKQMYAQHKHLPIYLAIIAKKITVLDEQPNISPLMLACAQKDAEKIIKLVQLGADVFSESMEHLSVLRIVTNLLSHIDDNYEQYKDILVIILAKIHNKYKDTYTLKEFKDTYTKKSLDEAIKEKFESYIAQHVRNPAALEVIKTEYPRYSFKTVDSQHETAAVARPGTVVTKPVRSAPKLLSEVAAAEILSTLGIYSTLKAADSSSKGSEVRARL
jgi:hypothetical protein